MIFALVMFLATLGLAGTAGYVSVMGFAGMFKSAFWIAFAFAASLEVGKLVAASFLYRYWTSVKLAMKTGMVASVIGLMIFTSAGLYGYLSSAYQEGSIGLNVTSDRITLLEEERTRSIDRKNAIDKQISDLPIDFVSARQRLQTSFGPEQEQITNRIAAIDTELLELRKQTIQEEAHVGPIIFIANTFGIESNKAMGLFILMVVLIFDPLAVMMTLATNHVILDVQRKRQAAKEHKAAAPVVVIPVPETTTTMSPDVTPLPTEPQPTTTAPTQPDTPHPEETQPLDTEPAAPSPTTIEPEQKPDVMEEIRSAVTMLADDARERKAKERLIQQVRSNKFTEEG